eukprot:3724058-Rhodomonas_salina.3
MARSVRMRTVRGPGLAWRNQSEIKAKSKRNQSEIKAKRVSFGYEVCVRPVGSCVSFGYQRCVCYACVLVFDSGGRAPGLVDAGHRGRFCPRRRCGGEVGRGAH